MLGRGIPSLQALGDKKAKRLRAARYLGPLCPPPTLDGGKKVAIELESYTGSCGLVVHCGYLVHIRHDGFATTLILAALNLGRNQTVPCIKAPPFFQILDDLSLIDDSPSQFMIFCNRLGIGSLARTIWCSVRSSMIETTINVQIVRNYRQGLLELLDDLPAKLAAFFPSAFPLSGSMEGLLCLKNVF
jgi:hypothetical protein